MERLAAIVPTTKYLDAEIAEVHRMLGGAVTHADLAAAVERDNSTRTAAVTHGGDLQRKLATVEAELEAHRRHMAELRDDLHTKVSRGALASHACSKSWSVDVCGMDCTGTTRRVDWVRDPE